ncbi:crotonase/enoyl-CoA hydratase family protein [Mycobacterium sp. MYCO198283]|uniref:crotonase/enoyl-CoA hydratase family protein n=1 Tax=Mycobacterium sp. MYCO198283 TaxID=2883505 RepID=UPI001E413BB7|nr:crotonase/enoyl-CoA hydratase family protein [Mycobacterium sp. MYCO198283]MCG5431936.1 crotonase/enoyl-CoA hydratase family protein [Mycobacterium sp. MYCO198283]
MSAPVSYQLDDDIATITLDDGKVNVLSLETQGHLRDAFDRAESDGAKAVVLAGNAKVFSAGFDLAVFQSGDRQASIDMLNGGFELTLRMLTFPRPIVVAQTGAAVAMGAFVLLAGDHRVGAAKHKIQAIEVAIGMTMPFAALEIMKLRLTRAAFQRAVGLASVYRGDAAVAAGWVDELTEPENVRTRAAEVAKELSALPTTAHLQSKLRAREEALAGIRHGIEIMDSEFEFQP